jgi:hypothetical protein
MRLYSAPAALLCLALSSLAAPTEFVSVNKYPGQVKPSSFIIKFKDNISKNARLSSNFTSRHGPGAHVTHGSWDESLFNGFAGESLFMLAFPHSVADDASRDASESR